MPKNPEQRKFLDEAAKELSGIEYDQLRRNWLDYQMCKLDVVQFFKKIKLLFRGARYDNIQDTEPDSSIILFTISQ